MGSCNTLTEFTITSLPAGVQIPQDNAQPSLAKVLLHFLFLITFPHLFALSVSTQSSSKIEKSCKYERTFFRVNDYISKCHYT